MIAIIQVSVSNSTPGSAAMLAIQKQWNWGAKYKKLKYGCKYEAN